MNCFILFTWLFMLIYASIGVTAYVGINWGRMASQRMIPSMVVDMLLQNGIREVKVFSASDNVMQAFAGADIGLTITVPNDDLKFLNSSEAAKKWVDENITPYVKDGVRITYVSVGAEPYSRMYFNKTYYEAVDVLKYIQVALDEADHGGIKIKVTMNHFTDILNDASVPSLGDFRDDIEELMVRTCQILNDNEAPIWLDIFPIYNVKKRFNNDIEFAFFENDSESKFKDGDKEYSNIFEVMYDTLAYTLQKHNFPNLKIIAGQVGWPTDGIRGANIQNAERFHKGLMKFIHSDKGTPLRPGPIDAYIHNLADENRLPIRQGDFLRHWGIYRFDGKPKFNIDFTGQGRNIKPVSAKGITHMPKRWCVFNNKTADMPTLRRLYDDACNRSDCTSLAPGGSCGNLTFPRNISYAFNMLFQMRSQKVSEKACQYEGLGMIVPNDPSTEGCSFPVEILSAEVVGGNGIIYSMGCKRFPMESGMTIILTLVSIFFTLNLG